MPKPKLTPWTDLDARKKAILAILRQSQKDDDFRRHCLSSPEYVRQAFVDLKMDVPGDVIVSFVPEGDRDNAIEHQSGSMVLEVPPAAATTDSQLTDFVRCTYDIWLTKKEKS
jgi:hypothetical protein